MRLKNLIIGDIRFQLKYGFYFVYTVFTIFYICLLFVFPVSVRDKAANLMIYSDPAAMGLFFMGAILLLEKSQNVLNSIAVSPVKVSEYIVSKVVSLGLIGTAVGTVIAASSGVKNLVLAVIGTFLGSVIFTLLGLIAAAGINSLNQFMMVTIPFEIIGMLPPLIYLFGIKNKFMLLHPGCIVIRMISGEGGFEPVLLLLFCSWIILIYYFAYRSIKKMFQTVGGAKL
jgi:fluoroquinolone transport system permease protein